MVVYDGEVLKGLMPEDFPDHPFEAVIQVGRTMMHATVETEEIGELTYAAKLHDSERFKNFGAIGTFHLHDLEIGDVVVLPH